MYLILAQTKGFHKILEIYQFRTDFTKVENGEITFSHQFSNLKKCFENDENIISHHFYQFYNVKSIELMSYV